MSQVPKTFSKYLLNHVLLRHVDEDGAEYFTVIATGRSGMSHIGLAKFVGVSHEAVNKLVRKVRRANPTTNNLPECLKPFAGMSLTLPGYSDPQGRDILDDSFCAVVVEYYAQWSKSKNRQNKVKAEQALELIQDLGMKFLQEKAEKLIHHLGMRIFIHNKTGWQQKTKSSASDNFEQEFAAHKERLTVREILKHELHPELTSAIEEWRKANRASKHIYWCTLDAMNKVLQGLTSREIKRNNDLPKSASIRDYFETRPLIDYSALNRLAANLIRDRAMPPVEAVQEAGKLYLSTRYTPKPVPIAENVYKADKRLRTEQQKRELAAGIQLSLPLGI